MKIRRLLLIILIILTIAIPNGARASGVDLSRIKFSTGSEPLIFQFGSVKLDGVVEQKIAFTRSEVNKVVEETLAEMQLSQSDIIKANESIEKAIRATQFTQEDINRIKDNLILSAGVVPQAGNALKVIKLIDSVMRSTSWDDIGTASVAILEDNTKDWVKNTATGFIGNAGELGENVNKHIEWYGNIVNVLDACSMMMKEHERTREKWKNIADGANAKRLLNKFYEALQVNIEKYKFESDKEGWTIKFDESAAGRTFTFLGADSNYQTWFLNMEMDQLNTDVVGSVAGEYKGKFTLTAEQDMSGFKLRAHETLKQMDVIKEAAASMQASGLIVKFATVAPGTVYVSRTITGTCEATIQPTGEMSFSYKADKDEKIIDISGTTVTMSMDASLSVISSGGVFEFELGATTDDLQIKTGSANFAMIAPDAKVTQNYSGTGNVSMGWEENMWKPWDDGEVTLKHANH